MHIKIYQFKNLLAGETQYYDEGAFNTIVDVVKKYKNNSEICMFGIQTLRDMLITNNGK